MKDNWCRKLDFPLSKSVKHIHSSDARKPKIMAAFKVATGATNVTEVKEITGSNPPRYRAHCFKKMQSWDGEGYYEIELAEDRS